MPAAPTLDRFVHESPPPASASAAELALVLDRFAVAARRISGALARAGLTGAHGSAGSENVHGEEQKKLDVVANDILLETFDGAGLVAMAASEEMEEPFSYGDRSARAPFVVAFDPMDGSSNIDVNGTLGTIFSIRRRRDGSIGDFLRAGHEQVAAGYVLFGPAVLFVYTSGAGVHLFALDPSRGEFLLARSGLRMPERGKAYAVNEGRAHAWAPGVRDFVERLKTPDPATGRAYATRYSASLVADVHRFLLEGGVYLYPADGAAAPTAGGKLRVLYECHPLAFVVEQAGGRASTGSGRVLDVVPASLHERIPLAIGSRSEVELFETFAGRP